MRRFLSWLVTVALISSLSGFLPFPTLTTYKTHGEGNVGKYAPGLLLVGLIKNGRRTAVAELEKALEAQQVAELPQVNVLILRVIPGDEQEAAILARKNPAVVFAEPDYAASASWASFSGKISNDQYFDKQWSLDKIGAPIIWDITTGSQDVLIAIVDSGVQLDHPDLAEKIWTNPGEIPNNHIDDDGNGKVDDLYGWHFFHRYTSNGFVPAEDSNVSDDFGHGTHVSGIVGASTDNHTGISGISWGSQILPVKVLDEYGSGWYSDIAAGIIYATDNGARIINLSLGGILPSELLRSSVDYAKNHDVLVIASSGNNGGAVFYPAAYKPVLAVASTDQNDQRPSFSNYGPQVDLAAPGTDILSTWYLNNYFIKSGTSMAAAHVSGTAALLRSRHPEFSADDIANILTQSALDIQPVGVDDYTGWGRLSANRAIGLMEKFPDLWVQSNIPELVMPNQVVTFTITYGNKGFGDAEDSWITSTFTLAEGGTQSSSWKGDTMPASSDPVTFTSTVTSGPPGSIMLHTVEISSLLTETNPIDNTNQKYFTMQYEVYFPIITKP